MTLHTETPERTLPVSDPLPTPTPEEALRESLDTLHSYLQDTESYLEEENHERVRLNLADLARVATAAIQQSYAVETPEPDYESLLVAAVRAACERRGYWMRAKYTTATRRGIYEALSGGRNQDSRAINATKHIETLIERGVLYRTPSGSFIGVTADQPGKGKRDA